jgi:hypothetical protein
MNQRNIILQTSVIGLLLLFVSCSSKDNKKSFYEGLLKTPYIISLNDSLIERHNDSLSRFTKNPPPPPPIPKTIGNFGMYYGNFNVIFYSDNRIFFHTKDNFHACGTGLRDDETDFLDIQPDDIIEVSDNSVFDLIQKIKNLVTDLLR